MGPTYTLSSHQDICLTDTVLSDKVTRRLQNHYHFLENCAASQLSNILILNICLIKISRVPFCNGIISLALASEVSPEKPPRLHKVSGYHTKDRKGATGTPFLSSPFPPASRQDWMGAADKRHSQAPTPLPLISGFLTQAISRENSRQL